MGDHPLDDIFADRELPLGAVRRLDVARLAQRPQLGDEKDSAQRRAGGSAEGDVSSDGAGSVAQLHKPVTQPTGRDGGSRLQHAAGNERDEQAAEEEQQRKGSAHAAVEVLNAKAARGRDRRARVLHG